MENFARRGVLRTLSTCKDGGGEASGGVVGLPMPAVG